MSLLPILNGQAAEGHPHLYTHGGAVKQSGKWQSGEIAVRTEEYKYIARGAPLTEVGHAHLDVSVLSAPPWRGDRTRPPSDWIHYFNRLPKRELYHLPSDPHELNNIVEGETAIAGDLHSLLAEYTARRPDLFAGTL